jgi:hypothetical protein
MSADILTFPGDGLPDRPVSEQEVDRLHSQNFKDLEGRINNCTLMVEIAMDLVIPLIMGIGPEKEKAQFAIGNAAQMLNQLHIDYQAAYYGEIDLDGERKP